MTATITKDLNLLI